MAVEQVKAEGSSPPHVKVFPSMETHVSQHLVSRLINSANSFLPWLNSENGAVLLVAEAQR